MATKVVRFKDTKFGGDEMTIEANPDYERWLRANFGDFEEVKSPAAKAKPPKAAKGK